MKLSAGNTIVLGGNCPGELSGEGQLPWVGIVRGKLSKVAIVRGAIVQGEIVLEPILRPERAFKMK